jgi:hypothetical protein
MTFRLQEPEAPFLNATSRGLQKAFNPRRETGAFCSGVNCRKLTATLNLLRLNGNFSGKYFLIKTHVTAF